jgi:hypothetical protein
VEDLVRQSQFAAMITALRSIRCFAQRAADVLDELEVLVDARSAMED